GIVAVIGWIALPIILIFWIIALLRKAPSAKKQLLWTLIICAVVTIGCTFGIRATQPAVAAPAAEASASASAE
ncbi:MAG: hypothetical protein ACI4WR_05185, partial [Bulleidia sp.]